MSQTYQPVERLLTKRDVAYLLGISRRTVDRLAAAGELQRIRVGKLTRFSAEDVRELVERSREEGGGP